MEIKNRRTYAIATGLLAVTIVVAAFVASLFVGGAQSGYQATGEQVTVEEPISFENIVHVYKNGEFVAWAKNKVTNIGLNHSRDAMMGQLNQTVVNISVIQLSTNGDAPDGTETACPSAVVDNALDAGLGTIAFAGAAAVADGNYSINKTWNPTGSQADIQKVCLHNSTLPTNITFSTALLSSAVNVENGDELSVYYYVKFSAA